MVSRLSPVSGEAVFVTLVLAFAGFILLPIAVTFFVKREKRRRRRRRSRRSSSSRVSP